MLKKRILCLIIITVAAHYAKAQAEAKAQALQKHQLQSDPKSLMSLPIGSKITFHVDIAVPSNSLAVYFNSSLMRQASYPSDLSLSDIYLIDQAKQMKTSPGEVTCALAKHPDSYHNGMGFTIAAGTPLTLTYRYGKKRKVGFFIGSRQMVRMVLNDQLLLECLTRYDDDESTYPTLTEVKQDLGRILDLKEQTLPPKILTQPVAEVVSNRLVLQQHIRLKPKGAIIIANNQALEINQGEQETNRCYLESYANYPIILRAGEAIPIQPSKTNESLDFAHKDFSLRCTSETFFSYKPMDAKLVNAITESILKVETDF